MLEKTLESPLDCKEIQPAPPKGIQSWIFIGRTDAEAEASILWLSYAKSWPISKRSDAGKDWRQEEKGMTEDEMVGWPTQWTWVWANSGRWWRTGKLTMLQFVRLQRVGHNWATEQQQSLVMLFTLQGTDMMNHNQLSHLYILHAPKKLHPFHNKVRDIKVDNVSQFSSVQLLSHVRLFETPWTAARQASPSITNSRSLLKLMSIELVMPSKHLILRGPHGVSTSVLISYKETLKSLK